MRPKVIKNGGPNPPPPPVIITPDYDFGTLFGPDTVDAGGSGTYYCEVTISDGTFVRDEWRILQDGIGTFDENVYTAPDIVVEDTEIYVQYFVVAKAYSGVLYGGGKSKKVKVLKNPKAFIGDDSVEKAYLGETLIDRAYVGDSRVF